MENEHEHDDEADGGRERAYTPAYVPIQTLLGFVDSLDPKALPRAIDRSMMPNYSGGVQRKLMSALAFLGLIRPGSNEVTEQLHELVKTKNDPEGRKTALANTLNTAYAKILKDLDVGSGSAKQLADAFREAGAEGSTLHEAIRFYLKARRAAGLPISKYIIEGKLGATATRATEKNGAKSRPKRPSPGEEDEKPESSDGQPDQRKRPENTIDVPMYFPGKPSGAITIPKNLNGADMKIVDAAVAMVRAYAEANEAK